MTATKLIALRVLVAIVAVVIFPFSAWLAVLSIVLFLFVEFIDMVDGLFAQYRGHRLPFGGFLDISADQCIEMLFWFLFLKYDLVPLWIPAFIMTRNTFVNLLRISALVGGGTMFGATGMLTSRIGRLLVATRFSRGIMVLVKTIGFIAVMLFFVADRYGPDALALIRLDPGLLHATAISAFVGLALIHLVRGVILVRDAKDTLGAFLWSAESAASTPVHR
jgi:phosphatidylglycerophosphate synthase